MLSNLNLKSLAGAVVSGVIVAVLGFLGNTVNIFEVDFQGLLSVAVLAAISSLLKALGTSEAGNFLGVVKVK